MKTDIIDLKEIKVQNKVKREELILKIKANTEDYSFWDYQKELTSFTFELFRNAFGQDPKIDFQNIEIILNYVLEEMKKRKVSSKPELIVQLSIGLYSNFYRFFPNTASSLRSLRMRIGFKTLMDFRVKFRKDHPTFEYDY
jgi:hypothetical protein